MGKSNVYHLPSESVTVYLERYTAERLLMALTQALEPGQEYYKKKSKKGKGPGVMTGMKLSKKGKGSPTYGLKMRKGASAGGDGRVVLKIPTGKS